MRPVRSIRRPPTECGPVPGVLARGFLLPSHCCALARAVAAQLRQPGTLFRVRSMTTISITAEASAAIEAAFPGDWRNEIRLDGKGGYLLTLPGLSAHATRRHDRPAGGDPGPR
jgi:hypothetical protein